MPIDVLDVKCIIFETNQGERRLYHAKSHVFGSLQMELRELKPVDPCEVMVYKILELLELGPEVIFYHNSIEEFYIATRMQVMNFLRLTTLWNLKLVGKHCGEIL